MGISMQKRVQEANTMTVQQIMNNVRLVKARSSKLTKVAVCLAIVLSTVALLTLHAATLDAKAQAEDLKDQAQKLEQNNNQLESNIEGLGSLEGVEQIAKDELGMVDPDTVIIKPEN